MAAQGKIRVHLGVLRSIEGGELVAALARSAVYIVDGMVRLRHNRIGQLLELLILAVLLVIIFTNNISTIAFHADESQWIATSGAFEVFIGGEFRSPVWEESLWTLTQPPATRYLIGIGRTTGGYGIADLNSPWAFSRSEAENIARGAMPQPGLLWWSRLPMALLSVGSCLLIFTLVTAAANRVAGYVALLLVAANPFLLEWLRRAMSEAPLLFFLLLATYAGHRSIVALEHARTGTLRGLSKSIKPVLLLGGMGLLIGIAGSVKLNGLTAILAATLLAIPIGILLGKNGQPPLRWLLWLMPLVVVVTAATVTFVLLNPYLYPDPLSRTLKLIEFRSDEIQKQLAALPDYAISGFTARLRLIHKYLFQYTTLVRIPGAGILNLLFFIVGLYQALQGAWRALVQTRQPGILAVILLMALMSAGPMLLTPLNWDRYFLLPMIFSIVFIAMGIVYSAQALAQAVMYVRQVQRQKRELVSSDGR